MPLVAFDFDGTLSDAEMTVLLGAAAEEAGLADGEPVVDRMRTITERAMNDEIEYAESLRRRVAVLEGLPDDRVARAFEAVELREDAPELLASLSAAGVRTAVLTGGFEDGVAAALERAGVGVDDVVANRLSRTGGALDGTVEGSLVEGTKDDALRELCADCGVDLADAVAVGDGANDLPMLEVAGLAVGFDPKPAVEPHCDVVVDSMAALRAELRERAIL